MNHYRKRKRGVSIIIGGVIFFALVFSTLLSYSIVTSETTHDYNISALEKSSDDRDRRIEDFKITSYPISGNIGFYINNTGGLPINIIAIFITNSTHHFYYNENTGGITPPLPLPLNPHSVSPSIDTGIVFVTDEIYEIKALSSRGEIRIGEFPNPTSPAAVYSAVAGLISIDIGTLEWAEWQTGDTPLTVTWSNSPEVPDNDNLVWRGVFDNHHTEDLYLKRDAIVSVLRAVPTSGDDIRMFWWYIIDTSDFTGYSDYSETIPAGGSATVTWGSRTIGSGMFWWTDQDIDYDGQYRVSIILHGRWGSGSGEDYGQVIGAGGIIVD